HHLLHRVVGEADGPRDPPVLAGDQVARLPRLQLEEAVVQPQRPEDLAAADPPPLDAQQGGIPSVVSSCTRKWSAGGAAGAAWSTSTSGPSDQASRARGASG